MSDDIDDIDDYMIYDNFFMHGYEMHELTVEEPDWIYKNLNIDGFSDEELKLKIVEHLKMIYDPEIPLNIYDIGLIYDVDIKNKKAEITMSLTSPNCPSAEKLPEMVGKACNIMGIHGAVKVVWEPKWGPDKMSDEARSVMGFD